jgi:hypothetical protein
MMHDALNLNRQPPADQAPGTVMLVLGTCGGTVQIHHDTQYSEAPKFKFGKLFQPPPAALLGLHC